MKNPNRWSLEEWIIALGILFLAALGLLVVSSCTLFEGRSNDGSDLYVKQRCDVRLYQNAKAEGMDDADVIESVKVLPSCETEIEFRQTIGDSVEDIEEPGLTNEGEANE